MSITSKKMPLPEKLNQFMDKILKKKTDATDSIASEEAPVSSDKVEIPAGMRISPDLSDYIAGEISDFKDELSPFLPTELIAGEVPYVPGMETETVWNAASQACATEKVHFAYAIDLENERVTYLACPSSALASAPDTWCPLVAALPGNPEFIDQNTVYVYEQDASAAALRWHEDTGRVQLFIGASRTILPKIQSMDTNFATIGKDNQNVIAWKNSQLKTEKLARAMTRSLMLTGMSISVILFLIVLFENMSLFFTKADLNDVTRETQTASNKIVQDSYKAMHSDILNHNVRIQELLNELSRIDGTLLKYEISKGKVTWEAYVPQAYLNSGNTAISGKIIEEDDAQDGRIRIRGTK